MFRSSQKVLVSNCGSTAARCFLSPSSPTTVSGAQMRSFFSPSPPCAMPAVSRYFASSAADNNSLGLDTQAINADINNLDNFGSDEDRSTFYSSASSLPLTYQEVGPGYGATTITASDHRAAAEKVWGSLYATPERLNHAVTGSAGSSRITHNLNHDNARWQASCVEVRQKEQKNGDEHENPVIARRNKQFGKQMPWEKTAVEMQGKFPKSDKFPADDDVEIVFYFETHDFEGVGLSGYQNIAARVSDGDLPGECSNLTAVGGYATWTVPRSEFVALSESKPLLGVMLAQAAPRKSTQTGFLEEDAESHRDVKDELRRVTIRMSTADDRNKQFAEATVM
eukprot:GILI01010013.1.p1 GENE.GILI01010013.1~~GILI01010013.1.p1  ORF type:complete len:339 (-),score=56.95 GILI01010013.1:213-1229(-)